MCHGRDATRVTTLRAILLAEHHDRGIVPLLRHTPATPCGDHNGVELLQYTYGGYDKDLRIEHFGRPFRFDKPGPALDGSLHLKERR